MSRSPRWRVVLTVGLTATAGVAGCSAEPDTPPTDAPPTEASALPSATRTDEQLLADARTTFDGYLIAGEEMARAEGIDYTTLEEWTSTEIATDDAALLQELADTGISISGRPLVTRFESVRIDMERAEVLACVDVRSQRYVDASGIDVTPEARPDTAVLRLDFDRGGDDRYLLVNIAGAFGEIECD